MKKKVCTTRAFEAWRDVLRELSDADIANMTPVQALVLLNEMQARIKELDGRMVG